MKYKLTAKVRKYGSIGIFYEKEFIIETLEKADPSFIKQKWFEFYSYNWELYHFISIDEVEKCSSHE